MSDIATPQRQLRLTPPQMSALAQMEQIIGFIEVTAALTQGITPVAYALTSAASELKAAHERYVSSLASTVSIAAPSELAEAVKGLVRP